VVDVQLCVALMGQWINYTRKRTRRVSG